MYEEVEVARHRSKPPSLWFSATEMPRVLAEISTLSCAWMPLLANAPRGDGHPVLVLPGFIANDSSTLVLRRFLSQLGYAALPWRLGQNTGEPAQQDKLVRRFRQITQDYDQPVSIVGQSLGGVFARELARLFPQSVRSVITLAAPFGAVDRGSTNPLVASLFEVMSGLTVEELRDRITANVPRIPPPVPFSAIYSKSDGVVAWQTCLEAESDCTENIEVIGSHSGMAMHPLVLHVIADRLSQPADAWSKFDRQCGVRRMFYPKPESLPKPESPQAR